MYEFIERVRIEAGDITEIEGVDAIISGTSADLKMDGSLNKAIVAAAGTQLDEFILENIYKPRTGDAFAVPGFNLKVPHIIYVVLPKWRDGFWDEDAQLLRCYRAAMQMAEQMNLTALAFPALGAGRGKFPVNRVARLGLQGIADRHLHQIASVRIVCKKPDVLEAFKNQLAKIRRGPSDAAAAAAVRS